MLIHYIVIAAFVIPVVDSEHVYALRGEHRELQPFARCQTGCRYHTDCAGSLVCLHRTKHNYEHPVWGCTVPLVNDNRNYCISLTDVPPNTLLYLGNLDERQIPLSLCQGDCDEDSDCLGSLTCFQRDGGSSDGEYNAVPGCSGEAEKHADYCVAPTVPITGGLGTLRYITNNPFPRQLDECEGNCYTDFDCVPGLWCSRGRPFAQSTFAVSGCAGNPNAFPGVTYCVDPNSPPVPGTPVGGDYQLRVVSNSPPSGSLDECEGDCDRDEDCRPGLVCTQGRSLAQTDDYVVGCWGPQVDWAEYCVDPFKIPGSIPPPPVAGDFQLRVVTNSPLPGQLDECLGDCDKDEDCRLGLVCSEGRPLAQTNDFVIGCSGTQESWAEYCVDPYKIPNPNADNGLVVVRENAPFGSLGECEGNCFRNDQCGGGLVCSILYYGTAQTPDAVVGCSGTPRPFPVTGYCVDPVNIPGSPNPPAGDDGDLVVVTNNPTSGSLFECQGNCRDDTDCWGRLLCTRNYLNVRSSTAVVGCDGAPGSAHFCFDPFKIPSNVLFYWGNDSIPSWAKPLGPCQGDCDDDDDCAGSMTCRKRNNEQDQIGNCVGQLVDLADYCF